MPVLEQKFFTKITAFNQAADKLIDSGNYTQAVKEYQKAWNTLPEPRQLWDAGLWIKMGQAECLLALGEYEQAKEKLLGAILCAGAVNNPLVHLYLGICYFETGDKGTALNELKQAREIEGDEVFQDGDEKYRNFLLASQS